jgi:hypothetical protein
VKSPKNVNYPLPGGAQLLVVVEETVTQVPVEGLDVGDGDQLDLTIKVRSEQRRVR